MTAAAIITIDDSGLRELARQLGEVDGDRGEALEAIGAGWETLTREHFANEAGPDGVRWKPSQRVLEGKKRGGGTLSLEGHLLDSITHDVVDSDTVEVGSNRVYAAAHQFGATIQRAGASAVPLVLPAGAVGGTVIVLPARPFIGWNAEHDAMAVEILEGFIAAKTGGAA